MLLKNYNHLSGLKQVFAFLVVTTIICSCGHQSTFEVTGNFRKADPTPIKLFHLLEEGSKMVDSVNLIEGTQFKLKGEIEHPSIYLLKYFNGQSIYLVIFPGDKIKLDIDNSTPELNYFIEGSADSKLVSELTVKQNLLLRKIDQLSKELDENPNDNLIRVKVEMAYAKLFKEHKDYTIKFIHDHPRSLANIMAVYQNFGKKSKPLFDKYEDLKVYSFVDSTLATLYPTSEAVKVLGKEVAETKEQIAQKKYVENTITEGRLIPTFYGHTISGDTVFIELNEVNPSLLFFWASWNKFSVDELLKINQLAKDLGAENINVITVSLDNSPEKLKKIVEADSIIVPVVCDYKYWDSDFAGRYSVKRIPSTILVNREGLIIAKDIFSDELKNKILPIIRTKR